MILTILVLSVLTLVFGFTTFNLLRKNERLEDDIETSDKYLVDIYSSIKDAYERMVKVDRLGSFEADDESGFIFKEIKSTLEQLNQQFNLDAEEKEE